MGTTSAQASQESLEFRLDGRSNTLPLLKGTENETGIDIRKLRKETGTITYDPGFANTGSCRSRITFINGEEGILRYRGYPIEQLAEKSTFLEVAWLLIHGELPTKDELEQFVGDVTHHTMLHENFRRFMGALPMNAHPMPVCAAAVGALATFYPEPESDQKIQNSVIRLLAKMPTLAAFAYKHSIGQPFIYPNNRLDYAGNFLRMLFANPCEEFEMPEAARRILEVLLILHADHEQNCSTSTVRMVGSSKANLFASISAGISALWGPLHGGANQKVVEMLQAIISGGETPESFLQRAKDKNDTTRLMGFGHRVYKNFDPRAVILKNACRGVLEKMHASGQLFETAMRLEQYALKDDYFVSRKLYPNVDFYSGVLYQALGIPVNMFTVIFALGRLPGWISHWLEMRSDPDFRIGRPRQIYTGATERAYVPLAQRG